MFLDIFGSECSANIAFVRIFSKLFLESYARRPHYYQQSVHISSVSTWHI